MHLILFAYSSFFPLGLSLFGSLPLSVCGNLSPSIKGGAISATRGALCTKFRLKICLKSEKAIPVYLCIKKFSVDEVCLSRTVVRALMMSSRV